MHLTTLNLTVIVVYRQPDDREHKHRSTSKEFNHFLGKLKEFLTSQPTPTPDTILLGDYNLPHGDWNSGECSTSAPRDEQIMVRSLYELALDHFLIQQVEFQTHKDGNVLDLIFTNNFNLIHNINALPSARSDHYVIEFSTVYKSPTPGAGNSSEVKDIQEEDPGFRDLNFFSEEVDWQSLESELAHHDWCRDFRGLDPSLMMSRFISTCLSITRQFVPLRKKLSNKQQNNRIPRDRRILMRKRRRIIQQRVVATTDARKEALTRRLVELEKNLQQSQLQQVEFEECKAIENIKRNPKFFFTYAKKFSKVKVGIGPLIDATKSLIVCPRKMAEILSRQYCSVFSQPQHPNIQSRELFPDEPLSESITTNIYLSNDELEAAMNDISINAAAGPDGFPAVLLKNCRHILAAPLASIWRKSLREGSVPITCKSANITPIHKGKSRALPKNYRPVALTSQLVKVFEKVVRAHIVSFMEHHQLFNSGQHGFRGGHSCLSQLLNHFDKVTSLLEQGKPVDVVYLDFAKAFDKVDIGITLSKLKSIGIRGQLGRWLTAFLTNRQQTVLVNGKKSAPQPVISGVPQGSVLGPLLFLVLIGDIDQDVSSSFLSSFADDTRVGRHIETEEDAQLLQADLNAVYEWARRNNMEFNSDKFEIIRYKVKSSTVQESTSYSSDMGSTIEEKTHLRDLGVTLSNDATFTKYISEKITSLKATTGWVLRTFRTRERQPMLTLWKQLILCHHDYCSQLWNPGKIGDIQALELVQRSYIRHIRGLQHLTYWEQLKKLGLYSLERRRERYIAIYIWRILEGHVPNFETTPISSQWHPRRGRECRVPRVLSTAPSHIQKIRYSSLMVMGPRIFNSLPQPIRNLTVCNVETFKARLDKYLASVSDEPSIPGYTQYRRCDTNSLLERCRTAPAITHTDEQAGRHDSADENARIMEWRSSMIDQ